MHQLIAHSEARLIMQELDKTDFEIRGKEALINYQEGNLSVDLFSTEEVQNLIALLN